MMALLNCLVLCSNDVFSLLLDFSMIYYFKKSRGLMRVFFILLILFSCQSTNKSSNEKKVLLISIDGLRPEFYLNKKYPALTLQKLAQENFAVKEMIPVFPSVTYPNHTTIITGVTPDQHGILSNTIFNWNDGPTTEWYWDHKYINVKTLNMILEEKGFETASIHWPVTLNANISYLIPEIFALKGWYEGTTWDLVRKYDSNNIVDEINREKNLSEFKNQKQSDAWATEAAIYLLNKKKPKLTLLHLTNLDKSQHQSGRESLKTYKSLKNIDEHIRSIYKHIDQNTCMMILGDHGFIDFKETVNINKLFFDRDWIRVKNSGEMVSWKVIAHKSGGQAAVYIKDKTLEAEVKALLIKNQKLGYNYVSRSELDKLGAYPEAFAAISAKEGFNIGSKVDSTLTVKYETVGGQHGHLPSHQKMQTGLIAVNCDLENKISKNKIKNTEIFNLILNFLNI